MKTSRTSSSHRHIILSLALMLLTTTACGPFQGDPIGQPEVEDYDRTCATSQDCAVVWLARACSCSAQESVNISEVSSVEKDNARETRFEGRCRSQVSCAPSPEVEASCDAGTCTLVTPTTDDKR